MSNLLEQPSDIPDDILILIFCYCDIDTVLAARLACTTYASVIQLYIKVIAPRAAGNTFPGCGLILLEPEEGYSLRWLRGRIPTQLASIILDKDKLRRFPYTNAGFPYGIPSESDCEEAIYWRARVANGWRVLRSMHLISKGIYAKRDNEIGTLHELKRMSIISRKSRWRQSMSRFSSSRIKQGVGQLFADKDQKSPVPAATDTSKDDVLARIHERESMILDERFALIERLPDEDLKCYVWLWRLLKWTFRPYRKPNGTIFGDRRLPYEDIPVPEPTTASMVAEIPHGSSWLNWYILFMGPSLFIEQWCPDYVSTSPKQPNALRNSIWKARRARTPQQIEVERGYILSIEFALRKRCLSSQNLEALGITRNSSPRTISSDYVPWAYDQHYMTARPATDFPWYQAGRYVWLDGDWCVRITPGTTWSRPSNLERSMTPYLYRWREVSMSALLADDWMEQDYGEPPEIVDGNGAKGPLAHVPYLVYLGTEEARKVWPDFRRYNGQFEL
jgi:hypothetical protein